MLGKLFCSLRAAESVIKGRWRRRETGAVKATQTINDRASRARTLPSLPSLFQSPAFLAWPVLCGSAVEGSSSFGTVQSLLAPDTHGLLLAVVQAPSLLGTQAVLGDELWD